LKRFHLAPSEIRPIATGFGSCIASDEITVGGHKVGYAYREEPDDKIDSGWRFFSGSESQAYADDPTNFAMYDINTIANYDPSITEFLEAPIGSAFARNGQGVFVQEAFPDEPDA
jgi:hypothetical protein